MKITVLLENTKKRPFLQAKHGISFHIEKDKKNYYLMSDPTIILSIMQIN